MPVYGTFYFDEKPYECAVSKWSSLDLKGFIVSHPELEGHNFSGMQAKWRQNISHTISLEWEPQATDSRVTSC